MFKKCIIAVYCFAYIFRCICTKCGCSLFFAVSKPVSKGDGVNDTWNILLLTFYPNCSVETFNRYGTLVMLSTGYSKPWDGLYNGKQLPTGVYFYIIDLKNGLSRLAGNVTLLR